MTFITLQIKTLYGAVSNPLSVLYLYCYGAAGDRRPNDGLSIGRQGGRGVADSQFLYFPLSVTSGNNTVYIDRADPVPLSTPRRLLHLPPHCHTHRFLRHEPPTASPPYRCQICQLHLRYNKKIKIIMSHMC